jgi:hypothetical protein
VSHDGSRRATVPIPDDMVVSDEITTADGVVLYLVNVWNDRDDADEIDAVRDSYRMAA